jgi:RNA polymerase sigma-70 factor, ECF subfamily
LAGLILGNAADAEDATQEALLRAWKSAGSLRDPGQARVWLDRIVVNVCRDRLRRIRTVRFVALPDDAGLTPVDPFQAVLQRDEAVRAIGYLDPDQRIVVVLHYWAGLTLTEIADRLQWPVGTVKSRLHSALERMRTRVDVPVRPIEAPQ